MVRQSIEERREAIRAKRILSIQFRIVKSRVKDFDNSWHLSTTHDMSFSGIAFLSDIPMQVDDVVELQVVMSGILDVCKGFGQVVRVEKKSTGVYCMVAVKFVESPLKKSKRASKSSSTNRLVQKKRRRSI